ncbi:hypothetical protein OIU78_022581 [Salix suchowensis]|nr:hypothetical protein OIU78_022581 [Salix suchowensis]
MEFAGNDWDFVGLEDCNNLSEKSKMSLIQGFCKRKEYVICLAGGELPEWFSHRGEGSALSFHLPSVSVPDGNKLQALLFWAVLDFTTGYSTEPFTGRVPLIGLEESLQGVEELELNVEVYTYFVHKYWVEKCGVHLIMEKSKADSDIDGEKWDHAIDLHALGSLTTDDQRLESSLIRGLQEWKITTLLNGQTIVLL